MPKDILAIAVGITPRPDAINMDKASLPGIDVVHNVENLPWPFESESFVEIQAYEIVIYIRDVMQFVDECWRVAKPNALLKIRYPLWDKEIGWIDPTIIRPFAKNSFDIFDPEANRGGKRYWWYTERKWKIVHREEASNGLYTVHLRKLS